tara:strand:- start:23598 stop:23888 length:291 start_codon:yes stop_codon:yes gene_type:complete
MIKHITLPFGGYNYRISLNNIVEVRQASATTLEIVYSAAFEVTPQNVDLTITHASDGSTFAMQDWFVDRMEEVLGTSWQHTSVELVPPYALTASPA